jgi:hypothetical protein
MASSKYRQGVFTPKNKEKFIGTSAMFRSGLELRFMRFCDNNPNVIKWSSENVIIPYISPFDNKTHRYYVDNFVMIKEDSEVKKYLIEIKPFRQTKPPTTKYKKKKHLIYEQKQWVINSCKWKAAIEYAKRTGCEFKIITEKDLK